MPINQNAAAAQGAFETLLGRSILVLPHFTPAGAATLAASVLSATQGATADAIELWLQQLTYVRPAIDRLDRVSGIAQMLSPGQVKADWIVLQQPYDPNDAWIGTASSPAAATTPGRLACVLQLAAAQVVGFGGAAGLMIDEWAERIPSATETTSLAFHFTEPSARAPQALLLAVGQPAQSWAWNASPPSPVPASDNIVTILDATLDLAKIRTVDPLVLQDGGQFLPFIYMPLNLSGASTGASNAGATQ